LVVFDRPTKLFLLHETLQILPPDLPPDNAETNGTARFAVEQKRSIYRCGTGLCGAERCRTESEKEGFKTGALNHSATLPSR
jgi:hypothetical protein